MKYHCYTCGIKLGDGIPPLEALSTYQADIVGNRDEDSELRFSTLEGTPFEGMSTYSFCEVCLATLQVAPEAFGNPAIEKYIVRHVNTKKEQYLIDNPEEAKERFPVFPDFWTEGGRVGRLTWAKEHFPDRDYSLVMELLGLDD